MYYGICDIFVFARTHIVALLNKRRRRWSDKMFLYEEKLCSTSTEVMGAYFK